MDLPFPHKTAGYSIQSIVLVIRSTEGVIGKDQGRVRIVDDSKAQGDIIDFGMFKPHLFCFFRSLFKRLWCRPLGAGPTGSSFG